MLGRCCSGNDGDLDQGDSGGDGDKRSELEFILKISWTGLADRLDLKRGRKIRSSALDILSLRCLLGVHVEMWSRQWEK